MGVWPNYFSRGVPQELTAPGPYGYLPSGEEGEEQPIEGEFRELPDEAPPVEKGESADGVSREPRGKQEKREEYLNRVQKEAASKGWPIPETYEQAVDLKRGEARAFELGREVEEAGRRKKIAQSKKERTAAGKAEFERRFGKYQAIKGEVTKTAGQLSKLGTLGGVPATQRAGGIRDLYFGRAGKGLYVPETPKASLVGPRTSISAAEALRPDLRQLKEATRLGAPQVRGTDVAYARRLVEGPGRDTSLQYGFLKGLAVPKGLSQIEHAAFAEIRANGDVDNMGHIKSELAQLGFPRREVEEAVRMLEEKGLVVKAQEVRGEPAVYEVARSAAGANEPPIFAAARGVR